MVVSQTINLFLITFFARPLFKPLFLPCFGLNPLNRMFTCSIFSMQPLSSSEHHLKFSLVFLPLTPTFIFLGCVCYPNTASIAMHKLAPRSSACVYLGASLDYQGYRCLDLATQRVVISCHVIFDETHLPYSNFHHSPTADAYDLFIPDETPSPLVLDPINSPTSVLPTTTPPPEAASEPSSSVASKPSHHSSPATSRTPPTSHPTVTKSCTSSLRTKEIFNLP